MLCLARDPPPSPLDDVKTSKIEPSSVYISYDNGESFRDKTDLFSITVNNVSKQSSIDQFITHPKYNTVSKVKKRGTKTFMYYNGILSEKQIGK